jgi:hypothetical protein
MTLRGHHGDVLALAVGKFGTFICSGSQDRSIRIWKRTEEQLFLEEERERELEQSLVQSLEKVNINEENKPTHQTMESLKAGERIMEAIELADEDRHTIQAYQEVSLSFIAYTLYLYFIRCWKKVLKYLHLHQKILFYLQWVILVQIVIYSRQLKEFAQAILMMHYFYFHLKKLFHYYII